MIITPHIAHLKTSLNLSHAYQGLSQANNTIFKLFNDFGDHPDITHDTKKLVEIVVKTGKMKVSQIIANMNMIDEYSNRRQKRSTEHPLYGVGNIADWAFGLTSHERFSKVNENIQDTLDKLAKHERIHDQDVEENTKVIQASLQTLKEMGKVLENIKDSDSMILKTDHLFLKIVHIKFELDHFLNSISKFVWKVTEILNQSDLGIPSRYLFSPNYLRRSLRHLNEKLANLFPVIGSENIETYFTLPLSVTDFDGSIIQSILTIPFVDSSEVFSVGYQNFHEGFIDLESFQYRVMMSFFQFKKCSKSQNKDTMCIFRPCLIKTEFKTFICYALNETSFVISTTKELKHITTLCEKDVKTIQVQQSRSYSHLSIPVHCQAQSQAFIIKNIPSVLSDRNTGTPSTSTILSVESTKIVTENDTIILSNLPIPLKLRQDNSHQHQTFSGVPSHYEPLLIGGTSVGILSVLLSFILFFWGIGRIKRKKETEKEDEKNEVDSSFKICNEQFEASEIKLDAPLETKIETEPLSKDVPKDYRKCVSDYLPPYRIQENLQTYACSKSAFSDSLPNQASLRAPFCGMLELRCEDLAQGLCSECKEVQNFSNETSFTVLALGQKIEENLKNSLSIPYNTPIKLWPQSDGVDQSKTVYLQFVMSITYAEHEEMMNCKMKLMQEMTDSNLDRVYLHKPAKIWNHSLSLYKIN